MGAILNPPTVTERCGTSEWGDRIGHHRRGEHQCDTCAAKQSAYLTLNRLANGRTARLSRADLRRLVAAFAAAYKPGPNAFDNAFEHAIVAAVKGR